MMFAGFLVAALLWLSYGESSSDAFYKCPVPCTCTSLLLMEETSEAAAGGRKVVCQRAMSITAILQILSDGLPVDTLHLDLSKNEITRVPRNSFENMKQLLRLDLSNNPLQELEDGSFLGLDSLEHLDLSGTKLTSLNSSVFDGLPMLQNLSLADGRLSSLPEGSLDRLPSLKTLNIRSDYLVCDCHLKWMTGWLEMTGVVLDASVVCYIPSKFKGRPLASLAADDLNCDFPLELPLFELNPSSMQVVFEGDRLPIECRTLVYNDEPMNVTWILETSANRPASHNSTTTFTELTLGRVRSTWLLLNPLEGHHSGNWKCEVTTIRGNLSKNVRVLVLTAETPYCRTDTVSGNKGSYHWPKTVAGALQSLPCVRGKSVSRRFGDVPVKSATRECDGSGQWKDMDAGRCGYISETTQFLEHFAKTEATIATLPRLVSHVEQLNDYVRKTDRIKDEIDILYISQIVEKLVKQVSASSKLADLLVSITSLLMNADADLLRRAEWKDKACKRLVAAVEAIPKNVVAGGEFAGSLTIETENILIHTESLDEDASNGGISCIVYEQTHQGLRKNVTTGRSSAECRTGMNLTKNVPVWKKPRLFVAVEPETVKAVKCSDLLDCRNKSQTILVVTVYKNSRLFPEVDTNEFHISSEIFSAKIVNDEIGEVNASAFVILQMMSDTNSQLKIPAFWNTAANGGYGGWSTSGCEVLNRTDTAVRFTCQGFGHYALLQDHPTVKSAVQLWLLRFIQTNPAIYVGSFALAASTLSVVIAFICARNRLKMSRKTCHATCNMCAGLLLLSVTYVMWLPADHSALLCSLGAVSLHFLSLSVLVWITIISYKLRKKLTKATEPRVQAEEDPVEDEPKAPRSAVTIYLLGWGVAFILCGISAAISWNSYNKDYCFLAQESSLLMFFIPVGLLLLINTFLLIHSCYIMQLHPSITSPSTGRPGDRHPTTRPDLISSHSSSSFLPTQQASEADELSVSSAMDAEYSPNGQLKAISAILLLYLLTWTTGAFAAVLPFPAIPLQETLFPCLYATAAISLAAFLFVYCCAARQDIREKLICCVKSKMKAKYDAVSPNIATEHDHQTSACSDNLSVDVATESSSCAWRSSQVNSSEAIGRRSKLDIDSLPSGNSTVPILPSVPVPFSDESSVPNAFNNTRQRSAAKKYWERKKCKMQRSSERSRKSLSGHQGSSAEECKLIDLTNAKPSAGYSSLNTTVFDRPYTQNKMPHRMSSKRSENRPCGSESPSKDARDLGEIGGLIPQQGAFRDEFIVGSEAPETFRNGNYVRTCKLSEHSDSPALPILPGSDNPVTAPFLEVSDDGLYDCDRVAFSRHLEPVKRTKDKSKHHHFRTSSVSGDHRGEASHAEVSWNLDPHCRVSSSKSSSQNSKGSRKRSTLLAENTPTRHPLHHRAELHEIKKPLDFERVPIGLPSGKIQHGDRLKPIGRSNRLPRRRMMLSSSEGSLADVWVLQKQYERKKFKKETSV